MALSTSGKTTALPCYYFSFQSQAVDNITSLYCGVNKLVYKRSHHLCTQRRWCQSLILNTLNILSLCKIGGKSKEKSDLLARINISTVQVFIFIYML